MLQQSCKHDHAQRSERKSRNAHPGRSSTRRGKVQVASGTRCERNAGSVDIRVGEPREILSIRPRAAEIVRRRSVLRLASRKARENAKGEQGGYRNNNSRPAGGKRQAQSPVLLAFLLLRVRGAPYGATVVLLPARGACHPHLELCRSGKTDRVAEK